MNESLKSNYFKQHNLQEMKIFRRSILCMKIKECTKDTNKVTVFYNNGIYVLLTSVVSDTSI